MMIYVDNVGVYGVAASSLNKDISMSSGTHTAVVQAWNSAGTVYKSSSLTLKVETSTIPSNATVFSQIENMNNWQSCDKCAGANGSGPSDVHWMAQNQTTPSLDGSSSEFYLSESTAYSDALWWRQLGPISTATHFVYDVYFYLKNPKAPQALEFDVNQSVGGKKYIFGTECDFTGIRHFKVWDYYTHWQDTGISCTAVQTANVWHHLVWEFQRTSTGHTNFIAVTMDGNRIPVNRLYNPQPSSVQELNVAFQMDGNSSLTTYEVWLDKVKLSVW
jgi:hypothetical protein